MISTTRTLLSGSTVRSNLQSLDETNRIILFQKATIQQQIETCYWLSKIFHSDFTMNLTGDFTESAKSLIEKVYDITSRHFSNGNSLYLYIGWDDHMWGCVGLDFNQHEPIISNLCVIPQMRGVGIAQQLMRFVESETIRCGFNYVKLWCNPNMVEFYQAQGYGDPLKIDRPDKVQVEIRYNNGLLQTTILSERELDGFLEKLDSGIEPKIDIIPCEELYILTKTLK